MAPDPVALCSSLAHTPIRQYLAVKDVLRANNIDPADVRARDAALQPELLAAVAGAGKSVMEKAAPQDAAMYERLYAMQVCAMCYVHGSIDLCGWFA